LCEDEISKFGITISGLQSGISKVTPFDRVDITVDRSGNVNYQMKIGPKLPANFSTELEARGSISSKGEVRIQRVTSKIAYNFNTRTEVGKQLDKLNLSPVSVAASSEGGGTIKLETFDNTMSAF